MLCRAHGVAVLWEAQNAPTWYSPDPGAEPQQLNKKCHSSVLDKSVYVVKPIPPRDDLLSRYSLREALAVLVAVYK